jgi:hypothetical protein
MRPDADRAGWSQARSRGSALASLAVALALAGCVGGDRPIASSIDGNIAVRNAPDAEFVQQIIIVLRAYAQPYLGEYLPRLSAMTWSVTVSAADAPAGHLGYDPATRAIVIPARAMAFPRDLLHGAAEAWIDRAGAEGAQGDLARVTWWVRAGMPLVAEGLAAVVWRDQGSADQRRDAVETALAADRLPVGIPVDRLVPLAEDVKAGKAWTLARLVAESPPSEAAAGAYAWAVCSFLIHGGQEARDLLAHAAYAETASPDPLSASATAREQAWQRYLSVVVLGAGMPR